VNTPIKIRIVRKGQDKPLDMTLTRDTIKVLSVRSHSEGDDVGYIRITQFTEPTNDALKKAIADLAAPHQVLQMRFADRRVDRRKRGAQQKGIQQVQRLERAAEQPSLQMPDVVSGEFRSLLIDIFGRSFSEKQFFMVDRDAVRRYKARVHRNVARVGERIDSILRNVTAAAA